MTEDDIKFYKDKSNSFIIISNLQKAIRRGYVNNAIETWGVLKHSNRGHALMRLATISVEDIGYGRSSLVREFLSTEIKKAEIEKRGGDDDYVEKIIISMCKSPKDNLCSQLVSENNNSESIINFFNEFQGLDSLNKLADIYKNSSDTVSRSIAMNLMIGNKKVKNDKLSSISESHFNNEYNEDERMDLIRLVNQDIGVPDDVQDVFEKSYKYHRESNVYNYPLVYSIYNKIYDGLEVNEFITAENHKEELIRETTEDYYVKIRDLNVLASSVDYHTSLGKSIIDQIIRENKKFSPDSIKEAIFKAKGGFKSTTLSRKIIIRENSNEVNNAIEFINENYYDLFINKLITRIGN